MRRRCALVRPAESPGNGGGHWDPDRLSQASELQNLALQWQADRLGIYEHSAGATAFVWRINLADDATAARVLELLQRGLPTISFRQQGTWIVAAGESDQQPGDWVFGP